MGRKLKIAGIVLGIIIVIGIISSLTNDPDSDSVPTQTVTTSAETAELAAATGTTAEIAPTATTVPAPTTEPTSTPTPTPPPPTPTPTPVPPTPTPTPPPEPKIYDGSGDDVVDIEKPGGPDAAAILYVTGNQSGGFFAVEGFGPDGKHTDLFVNTTDPYEGTRPLDFRQDQRTTRLQVSAEGPWHIEVRPLSQARVVAMPGQVTGHGDEVIIVQGSSDTAQISGNQESGFFGVVAWGDDGTDLLVNTTDPYSGRVVIGVEPVLIEVMADGDWTITFE